ncbi:hypothetical protein N7510_011065 [Penicillium lagena]|uniref:uncharacterized protein n=1 Tax=Penicillium lagena TaxID=94218 RepID=UPI002541BB31|nr:uncharacterized protein N7510_011065 [Penicillium lagena]KAJ5601531.1 hypothetical protein N7510_011065 [Penicillium lagena]
MDKQRTYVAGQPFDLHFYDSDVRLLQTSTSNDSLQQGRKAHIHMMAIWEDIYIHLYSLRALRSSSTHRQHHIANLDRLCRNWYSRHSALLTTRCNTEKSALECWHIELKYAFHIGQILVHRCSNEEGSQQVALVNSRAALQIIRDVFQSKHSQGSIWLLSK